MKVLFIVDPQNDFVDPKGSLYVKGAEEAIDNICELLKSGGIDRVIVSQDSHQFYHIGHSEFWKELPEPGTVIEIPGDLSKGNFTPALCDFENKKEVIRRVYEKNSRNIRIWPHHCLEGSWGYCFPDRLTVALNNWSVEHLKPFEVYQKGGDPFCESFSLLDEQTPDFSGTTRFLICGFCKDICMLETLKAIVEADVLPHYVESLEVVDHCSVAYGPDDNVLESKIQEIFNTWQEKNREEFEDVKEMPQDMVVQLNMPAAEEPMPRNMEADGGIARGGGRVI